MIPVMTMEDIHDATETFARYGVPADRIFYEIMRARYLDYVLFLNPANQQYGISIEDLYENMKKTADRLGMYEGDADTYVRVYTLALRVDPMAFAPGIHQTGKEMESLVEEALKRAEKSGKTVLFSGVESYMVYAARIADRLPDKRLAFVVESSSWKKKLQLVFPRCRLLTSHELKEDTISYDYIFHFGHGDSSEELSLLSRLSDEGTMDWILPYPAFSISDVSMENIKKEILSEKKMEAYYDLSLGGLEYAFLRFGEKKKQSISFGNVIFAEKACRFFEMLRLPFDSFAQADEWNYDVYIYNAFPALQAILAGNILQMDHAVEQEFKIITKETIPEGQYSLLTTASITDSEIRKDEVKAFLSDGKKEGILLQEGDLAISVHKGQIHLLPVEEGNVYMAGDQVFGLRSKGKYSAWYLKLYLDGPVGHLFLNTMKAGEEYAFTLSRFLRIPLPVSDEHTIAESSRMAREAVSNLADAEENWRKAKRNAVGLMMGHSLT